MLWQNWRIHGRELGLRFSNGIERKYERLPKVGNEAVIIVAVSDDAEIMLVREYCAGFHEVRLSLPRVLVRLGSLGGDV